MKLLSLYDICTFKILLPRLLFFFLNVNILGRLFADSRILIGSVLDLLYPALIELLNELVSLVQAHFDFFLFPLVVVSVLPLIRVLVIGLRAFVRVEFQMSLLPLAHILILIVFDLFLEVFNDGFHALLLHLLLLNFGLISLGGIFLLIVVLVLFFKKIRIGVLLLEFDGLVCKLMGAFPRSYGLLLLIVVLKLLIVVVLVFGLWLWFFRFGITV